MELKDKELVSQLRNVLRLKAGDNIVLADGKGNEAVVSLGDVKGKTIKAKILKRQKNENESAVDIILYCSILKRENFELVAQKAVEVGVKEIAPVITERTVKTGFKKERLEKIIKEAAEQSERGVLPVLREPVSFRQATTEAVANDANLIFDKSGGAIKKLEMKVNKKMGVFIGPEGGWSESELQVAREANFKVANLGNLILRSETAAIVASYLMTNFTS